MWLARSQFLVAIGMMVIVGTAPAHAQGPLVQIPGKLFPQMPTELLPAPPNETGFTLGDLFDNNKLWAVARHPLRRDILNRIGGDIHRTPRAGVQFELFTPGAAGATIHWRW